MGIPFSSSITPNLANTPQTKDPVLYQELSKIYAAVNRMYQEETNNTRVVATFAAAQASGTIVSLTNVSGVLNGILANATDSTKPAYGFIGAVAPITGGTTEVMCIGLNRWCTGLTAGGLCYLSAATSGAITQTKPVGSGKIVQPIGFAVSATSMFFNPSYDWTQL